MDRTLNVDYYDLVLRGGEPGTPEFYDERRIEALLRRCREGIQRVLWRLSVCGKEAYHSKVRTPFDWAEPRAENDRMTAVMQRFDPLAVACELAPRYGLRRYPWITLMDDYYSGNLESGFVAAQPGYQFDEPRRHTPLPRDALLQLSRGPRPPGRPTSRDRRRLSHRRVLPVPAQPRRRMRAVLPARLLRL